MAQTKRIAVNTLAIFLGKAVGLIVGIIRLNVVTSALGVATFGALSFAMYIVALSAVLADLGIPSIITRDVARSPERSAILLWHGFLAKLTTLGTTAILLIVVTTLSGLDPETTGAVLLTLVAFLFTNVSTLFLSILQGQQRMALVSIILLSTDLLTSVAVIVALTITPSITAVLIVSIAVAVINLVVVIAIVRRIVGPFRCSTEVPLIRYLLREGFPLALGGLGITTYTYVGSTVLNYTRGRTEIGLYGAAYKLFSIVTLVPASFTQVVYPVLSGFYESAPEKLHKAFVDGMRILALFSVPLAMGGAILAPGIVSLIFPAEFAPAASAATILFAGCSVGFLNWLIVTFLLSINRQRFTTVLTLVVGAVVVVANLMFIPIYGFMAAAWIVTATDAILFLSFIVYLARVGYAVPLGRILGRPLLASGVMGVLLLSLPGIPVLLAIVGGIVVYAAMLILVRGLGQQERDILRMILQKVRPNG